MPRDACLRPRWTRRGRLALAALPIACLAATGCGGGPPPKLSEHSRQAARAAPVGLEQRAPPPPVRCLTGSAAVGSAKVAYAAVVPGGVVARRAPGSGEVVARLGHLDVNGFATVLGVIGVELSRSCQARWYRVELPVLPNGTTGWVPAGAIQLYRVPSRIVISLSQRTLRAYRWGKVVLRTRVGIGSPATPTPVGRFFVDERYVLSSDQGPFGPNVLGISAHSDVLQDTWVQNGPIGVHGTDEPASVGQAASHGCIRLANDVMRRLFPLAPAGTPVIIRG